MNWIVIAFLAPFFWAAVNLIDLYFIKEVYKDEYDGTIIAGLFQGLPVLLLFIGVTLPDARLFIPAVLAGLLFVGSYFFYFKALNEKADAAWVLIMWNLVALVVPILAFFFIGERLSLVQYAGIAVTFFGAMLYSVISGSKDKDNGRIIFIMLGAILFLSFSMVIQGWVYNQADFWGCFVAFSIGGIMAGFLAMLIKSRKSEGVFNHILALNKEYLLFFIFAEVLNLCGIFTAQKAIDLSPSVSFVAAIESFQPAFILIISALIFVVFRYIMKKSDSVAQELYRDQLQSSALKVLTVGIMAVGIYLING